MPARKSGDVEVEGIMLPVSTGAIPANSFVVLDFFETAPFSKYVPFNAVHIFNDSTSLLEIRPNQRIDKPHFVAGKTEKSITGLNLYTIYVGELSGVDVPVGPVGSVRLVLEKPGAGADEFFKQLARWWWFKRL